MASQRNGGIAWTDETWNPLRGCSRVSDGCTRCYAERTAARFRDVGQAYHGLVRTQANGQPQWTGAVRLVPELLDQPLRWKTPRRVFVNSMSDLFHEKVPDEWIDRIFGAMALAPQHVFQVLTKRADRMRTYLTTPRPRGLLSEAIAEFYVAQPAIAGRWQLTVERASALRWPLPNVWLGVSVENRDTRSRLDDLRATPAAVRMVSLEPLLEDLGTLDLAGIGWVIVGGESGPGARPMHPSWARSIRDQCQAAGVPFFFKQWGDWLPIVYVDSKTKRSLLCFTERKNRELLLGDGCTPPGMDRRDLVNVRRVGKKAAGRLLDGREWSEFPQPDAMRAARMA